MALRNKRKKKKEAKSHIPSVEELKISYDKELRAHNYLRAYLDDLNIPIRDREKRMPEFELILSRLNDLIGGIEERWRPMTGDEILNGFSKTSELGPDELKNSPVLTSVPTLPKDFELGDEFRECFAKVEQGKSLLLEGNAGTGKTTFLTYWSRNTKKNYVIVAPTGIAAINSGGQTIHSFFKFPPELVQKKDVRELQRIGQVFRVLDVLVIDEVSMLRADLLDAIDYSLRINRKVHDVPFGGVQIILIGDLCQLPPIVDKELAEHFGELYDTPYFFSAKVFSDAQFHQFILKKNYRQRDAKFMSLLNKVRNRSITEDDLRLLNTRVNSVLAETWDNAIRLTPTNAAANAINQIRLAELPGKEFLYEAVIKGDFDNALYPTETQLKLKVGAQVLMVKNDNPSRRWVNGSIGEVIELNSDAVKVRIGHGVHDVTPVIWEKIKYRHDEQTDGIVSDVVGSFEQYPIRLAWAVTIHKSQGLTFDRVVVDFGEGTFVHGQCYVALSRCRSIEGLVLKRAVNFSDIIYDERIHRISKLFTPHEGNPTL